MSFDEMLGAIRADDTADGDPDLVDATRLRVMRSLEARARGRHRLVGFATMLGVLLVGTVSWALATGQVIAFWKPAAEPQLVPAPPPAPPPPVQKPRPQRHASHPSPAQSPGAVVPEPELLPPEPDLAAPETELASPEPDVVSAAELMPAQPSLAQPPELMPAQPSLAQPSQLVPPAPELVPPARPSLAQPPQVVPPAPERVPSHQPLVTPPRRAAAPPRATPVEPVEAQYRKAHELHFHGGDPAAALAAWDAYLAAEPDGRFSVEARYNRALVLVRLARYAEARAALAPFARGDIAPRGYRQAEAEQLVERLARFE